MKSFFLGPQAENFTAFHKILLTILKDWKKWRVNRFPKDGAAISINDQKSSLFRRNIQRTHFAISELSERLEKEVPKFSPRYIGHMLSEVSLPALLGHFSVMLHNPNNISSESSMVGTEIEAEAVRYLAQMVGYESQAGFWKNRSVGHFTSGGTVANFEAIWRAKTRARLWCESSKSSSNPFFRASLGWKKYKSGASWNLKQSTKQEVPWNDFLSLGPVMLVPENMHYSWQKGADIFGLEQNSLWPIGLDKNAKLSSVDLRYKLFAAQKQKRPVMMIVSVVGSTEFGGIDPVHEVEKILRGWRKKGVHLWHHVDAAYGGYFCSLLSSKENAKTSKNRISGNAEIRLSQDNRRALRGIRSTQSITIDPHKLGYVPYSSGAFLVRRPEDYFFNFVKKAPYIHFDIRKDRGPFTLEGSRSATGAVATWMTAKTVGFHTEGYGLLLDRTIRMKEELRAELQALNQKNISIKVAPGCETNILCFVCAKQGEKLSQTNIRTLDLFQKFSSFGSGEYFLSKTNLSMDSHVLFIKNWVKDWNGKIDVENMNLIRATLMNPFFGSINMKKNHSVEFVKVLARELDRMK